MSTIDEIDGNEFVINLSQRQYNDFGEYWHELADKRAKATNRAVVTSVDDDIRYRAWPQRESIYKGISEES